MTATNGSHIVVIKKVFNVLYSDINGTLASPIAVSCDPADLSDGTELDQKSYNTLICGVKSLSLFGIENGIVRYTGNNTGDIAVYSCLSCCFTGSSYEIFIRTCTENGNWTRTTPKCDCSRSIFNQCN